ncbi:MAG: translocation/assembly module TamB domain-containing protein [Acidobacteriales bacterium]|nr:translocation/assembly module TamB domain-containing protein [Terriglobales bacterium]
MTGARQLGGGTQKAIWKSVLLLALVGALTLAGLVWFLNTQSFQLMARRRVVAVLEGMSGGKVEIGAFQVRPFRLQIEIGNLTIHGNEPSGEIPYAHIDHVSARLKLISLARSAFGFRFLILDRPSVHIIVNPDGTTNQPEPQRTQSGKQRPIKELFSFSISRLEVRNGQAIWNNEMFPLNFAADNISSSLRYSLLHRRYHGTIAVGKASTRIKELPPLEWKAEAEFAISRKVLDVRSLKIDSANSWVKATGQVEDFLNPKILGTYTATVDLAQIGLLPFQVRYGLLEVKGRGDWTAHTFSSLGKFNLKNLEWRNHEAHFTNAGVSAQFSLNPKKLALWDIDGHLLGGAIGGEGQVANWLANASARVQVDKNNEPQNGSLRLRLKGVSITEVMAMLSTPARPFSHMRLVGTGSGTLDAKWKGKLQNAEIETALEVAAPLHPEPGQLPLNARTRLIYRLAQRELAVLDFNAFTPATEVRAAGTLSSSAELKLLVNTSDLGEWQPVLFAVGYKNQIPVKLHGRALFTGTATGRLSDIEFSGDLRSQGFDLIIPATTHAPEKEVRWDSLSAEVQLSPHVFAAKNGLLRHGEAVLTFNLRASLEDREFNERSPFTASVIVRHGDIAQILGLAGYNYPATGVADFSLNAGGTRIEPQGEGRLQLTNAAIHGYAVQKATSAISLSGYKVSFTGIDLKHHDAQMTGDLSYEFGSTTFNFNLQGKNFDLLEIPQLRDNRFKTAGRVDFEVSKAGTLQNPVITANVQLRDVTVDQGRAGDMLLEAHTDGAMLRLTGHSRFGQSGPEGAVVDLDGTVDPHGDWISNLSLNLGNFPIGPLLHTYLPGRFTGLSGVTGRVQLQGPVRRPRDLNISATLSEVHGEIENVKIHNDGTVRFAVANQNLRVEQAHLVGESTDITVSGTIQLTEPRQLELHAQGGVNLKFLQGINPDFTSSGMLTADVTLSGTMGQPVVQGRAQVVAAAISYEDLPSGLSDVNGTVIFNQNRLQIESLTARVGGGLMTFSGYATSYNRQLNFDVRLQQRDVRLRYPPGISSTSTADLHLAGTPAASTLSGDIIVTKLAMTPGFDFGAYLARSAQASSLPQTNPLLNRVRLDVHISTLPELQMQTAVVRLSGDADLHLRGTAAKPVLLGRADVIEGEAHFNGSKYRLERGAVNFVSPVTTTPVLDLQAATHVRDYDITINLNGEIDKLNVTYRSEPPLPTADIIGLLAFGQASGQSAQLQQTGRTQFSGEASNAIISEALNATVSNRVQRLFGASRIKIDPQGLSTETTPTQTGPAVIIEQQVADNVTLTYSTSVSQASQQIIQGVYNLTRNVSIVAIRDQTGVVSLDLRIRRRKR